MKILLLLCMSIALVSASSWDPYAGTSIDGYKESSFRALFKTNEAQRRYNNVSSLLKDDQKPSSKSSPPPPLREGKPLLMLIAPCFQAENLHVPNPE